MTKAILPSKAFAEPLPFSLGRYGQWSIREIKLTRTNGLVEESPSLTPDAISKEQNLSLLGLELLSHLQAKIRPEQDRSLTTLVTCLAAFSDENDPWSSITCSERASSLIEKIIRDRNHLGSLLQALLEQEIRPRFAKSKSPAITQQGRKAIDPMPDNQAFNVDLEAESKLWKYRDVYMVTVFRWVLLHLDVYYRSKLL